MSRGRVGRYFAECFVRCVERVLPYNWILEFLDVVASEEEGKGGRLDELEAIRSVD